VVAVSSGGSAHPAPDTLRDSAGPAPGSPPRLLVVGQDRVGLPLALRAVAAGYDVVGYDQRTSRVRRLTGGDPQLPAVPREVLLEALGTGRYTVSDNAEDCADFDVAVIAESVPLRAGAPDLATLDPSSVESAAVMVAPLLRAGCLVILETTTYPGTTEQLLVPTLELISGLRAPADFAVGYSPDRVAPDHGPAQHLPPRAVAGVDRRSAERTAAFYRTLGEDLVILPEIEKVELAKLTELTLHYGNPAMIEWLALLVADLGLDFEAVIAQALAGETDPPGRRDQGAGPAPPQPPVRGPDAGSAAELARCRFPFDARESDRIAHPAES
jgi:UDP-N-acetyl-D-glucosamine dehydrogenase